MKNLLFIGPYRQQDGWGLASRDYIRAISTNKNINISTRPIYLAPNNNDVHFDDEQIIAYENIKYDHYDYVVQKVLPEYFHYDARFGKNIGLFTLEINDFSKSSVIRNINRMDEIWVPSSVEKDTLVKSGVTKPIKVISEPLDITKLDPNHKTKFNPNIQDYFKFYTICENNYRKNLKDLILAFNLAFSVNDPVILIIKTTGHPQQLQEFSDSIKKKLHLNRPFKKELWVTNRMSDEEMMSFHSGCDCFVMPSYGEAFCRPAAEALCLGKNPIINKNTGTKDFINSDNGFLVKSYKTPIVLDVHPIAGNTDYYNANQYWYQIDVYDLIDKMQQAFYLYQKDRKAWEAKSQLGIQSKEQFSYENIGKKTCIQASL